LLGKHDHILLVAESKDKLLGFVIGRLMSSPEVYDPGGFTLMIDDFCVESLPDWAVVGKNLFSRIKELAKSKGVVQIVAVTGHHDERKRQFLQSLGLTIASEWYVGGLE
jgi:GNAT superfamily N-acetyltransferase